MASPPPEGGALHEGELLFVEHFDDLDFSGRGWFDGTGGVIDTAEHAPGVRSTLAWNELYLAPYIPAGASMAFAIWIDELTVARGQ